MATTSIAQADERAARLAHAQDEVGHLEAALEQLAAIGIGGRQRTRVEIWLQGARVALAIAEREGTDMATIRQRQIEAIAGIMRERDEALLAYGGEGLTYEDASQTNRAGWTMDLSPVAALDRRERATSEDRVIRHAGVVLTDDELRRAWDLARPAGA